MEIDLHRYEPRQIVETDTLAKIVQRTIPAINSWSRPNARHLTRIRQHRHRVFWTSNSPCLRHDRVLRKWIKYTTLDCHNRASTTVKLTPNSAPVCSALGPDVLPDRTSSGETF